MFNSIVLKYVCTASSNTMLIISQLPNFDASRMFLKNLFLCTVQNVHYLTFLIKTVHNLIDKIMIVSRVIHVCSKSMKCMEIVAYDIIITRLPKRCYLNIKNTLATGKSTRHNIIMNGVSQCH